MAPEQAAGDPDVDHRADIYAFGAMAYEMLAGRAPFAGRSAQQMLAAHVTEAPVALSARRAPPCRPRCRALVMRCLEKRPADRPQTARELVQALDTVTVSRRGDRAGKSHIDADAMDDSAESSRSRSASPHGSPFAPPAPRTSTLGACWSRRSRI